MKFNVDTLTCANWLIIIMITITIIVFVSLIKMHDIGLILHVRVTINEYH